MNVTTLFESVDHAEDVCLMSDGTLALGGERGQLYIGDPSTGTVSRRGTVKGRTLGVARDLHDNIYLCNPGLRRVVKASPDLEVVVFSDGTADRPMYHPNYLAFGQDATAFISDSGHWRQGDGAIFVRRATGETLVGSLEFPRFPNGLAVSPDGSYLYVVESEYGVSRAKIRGAVVGARESVLAMPGIVPDGIAFAADGTLLIACYQPNQILHIDGQGRLQIVAEDPLGQQLSMPTNLAFFGPAMDQLAVPNLGGRTVVQIDIGIAGAPLVLPEPPLPRLRAAA